MKKIAFLVLFLFLYGCSLYSNRIEKPKVELPAVSIKKKADTVNSNWWSLFKNKELTDLIKEGIKNNTDLLIAFEKIKQFEAQYGISKANLFPSIEGSFAYSRSKASRKLYMSSKPTNNFNLNASVNFNIDLFNRLNNARKAQLHKLLAQKNYANEVKLNLVSSIASVYFDLCINRQISEIYKDIIENDVKIVNSLRKQYSIGLVSNSDVESERVKLLSDRNNLEECLEKIDVDRLNLAFLLGKQPSKMGTFNPSCDTNITPVAIPSFLPSSVIKKRPDIQEALNNLKSAEFNLKSTKADLLPSISFTAQGGYESDQLRKLVMPNAQFWNILLNALMPIFEFGRISNQIKEASSLKRQAVLAYVNTVKSAFRDIFVDLSRIDILRKQYNNVAGMEKSSCSIYDTTQKEYLNGVKSIVDTLYMKNSCLRNRIGVLTTKLYYIKAEISLYKDLGGGW